MRYKREKYLKKLISRMNNGRVKIVTGIRRSGKSYLLFELFYEYLLDRGVRPDHIICLALDDVENLRYRNPLELNRFVRERITDSERYYVLLDEIQFVEEVDNPFLENSENKITFTDVILGLMKICDVYVTGSNSRMLSSDILTQFRDRGDEIRVFPLSFSEFMENYRDNPRTAWRDYYTYGGMPYCMTLGSHEEKSSYLRNLFTGTYLKDVIERNSIHNEQSILEDLVNIIASSTGSLSNPVKLANTFASERKLNISPATVSRYLDYFEDAYLISSAHRYDVKGRKYLKTPLKYYFTDVGIRNARLGFRQQEENHIMENVIYCELINRGYDVDVGVVNYNYRNEKGISARKQLEVDFVVNRGSERYYIQSALNVDGPAKRAQETESLKRISDSFRKIVIVRDYIKPWKDENGILYAGVEDFLLDENLINM